MKEGRWEGEGEKDRNYNEGERVNSEREVLEENLEIKKRCKADEFG